MASPGHLLEKAQALPRPTESEREFLIRLPDDSSALRSSGLSFSSSTIYSSLRDIKQWRTEQPVLIKTHNITDDHNLNNEKQGGNVSKT